MKLDIRAFVILCLIAAGLGYFLFVSTDDGLVPAPLPEMTTIDGQAITKADLKGKAHMVVFWATDCVTCVAEIPAVNALYEENKGKGLGVIAIAMAHDTLSQIKTMREQKDIRYPIVFDESGLLNKAYGGIRLTPTILLVSKKGKIKLQHLGPFKKDEFDQHIAALL